MSFFWRVHVHGTLDTWILSYYTDVSSFAASKCSNHRSFAQHILNAQSPRHRTLDLSSGSIGQMLETYGTMTGQGLCFTRFQLFNVHLGKWGPWTLVLDSTRTYHLFAKNSKVKLLSSWDGFDEVWSENQLGIVHLFGGNPWLFWESVISLPTSPNLNWHSGQESRIYSWPHLVEAEVADETQLLP